MVVQFGRNSLSLEVIWEMSDDTPLTFPVIAARPLAVGAAGAELTDLLEGYLSASPAP